MSDAPLPIIATCPSCGKAMDVTHLLPFTNAECPHCKAYSRVKTDMGAYKLTGRLGKGGMSLVFRAEDNVLGREVALKILNDTYAKDEVRREAFEREARTMARVSHENLVKVYNVGHAQGMFYIAMELVDGVGLDQMIDTEGRISEEEVLRLTIDITRGLDAAYQAGLIHRDIKPANVLCTHQGVAKIVDFGLSLLQGENSEEKEVWVTPYYAAPETLVRDAEDCRTDMYALGASMYHMLTGNPPPIDAKQQSDVLLEQKRNTPPLEEKIHNISPLTCYIVNRLMAFNREDRFESYQELIQILTQALADYKTTISEYVGSSWADVNTIQSRQKRRKSQKMIVLVAACCALLGIWVATRDDSTTVIVPDVNKVQEETIADVESKETSHQRAVRFGNMFIAAQNALYEGNIEEAKKRFEDLSKEKSCPMSTFLWSSLNQALCLSVQEKGEEADSCLHEALNVYASSRSQEEKERAMDVAQLIEDIINSKPSSPEKQPLTDDSIHFNVAMMMKAWNNETEFQRFIVYYSFLRKQSESAPSKELKTTVSAWLDASKPLYDNATKLADIMYTSAKTVAECEVKLKKLDDLLAEAIRNTEDSTRFPSIISRMKFAVEDVKAVRESEEAIVKAKEEEERLNQSKNVDEKKSSSAETLDEKNKKLEETKALAKEKERLRREAEEKRRADQARREANRQISFYEIRGDMLECIAETNDYRKAFEIYQEKKNRVIPSHSKRMEAYAKLVLYTSPLMELLNEYLPKTLEKRKSKIIRMNGSRYRLIAIRNQTQLVFEETGSSKMRVVYDWNELEFDVFKTIVDDCVQSNYAVFNKNKEKNYTAPMFTYRLLNRDIEFDDFKREVKRINNKYPFSKEELQSILELLSDLMPRDYRESSSSRRSRNRD